MTRLIVSRILLALGGVVSVMCILLFIGMRIDDRRIDAHRATATATVLTVSPLRTGIEFVDAQGVAIRPAGGVLYPGLLSVGQQFVVEFDATDPTVVRVAGRTAAVGNLMITATLVGTWIIAGLLLLWVRRPVVPWLRRPTRRSPDQLLEATSANTSPASSGTQTTNPSNGSD
jgi:hypothetical protein